MRFVLAGPKGVGKSSIFSRLSPQASSSTKSGPNQTIPVQPALFSVVTLDFPSATFSALTQRDSIPQVLSNAHAIIYVMVDPEDENLKQLNSLLMACDLLPHLFVLLHQIDRIDKADQEEKISKSIQTASQLGISADHCFATSLFDGSLTQAFSQITSSLMPKFNDLKKNVSLLGKSINADRIMICDAATFLPVCDTNPSSNENPHSIFEFFLRMYPKKKRISKFIFQCNKSVVVFRSVSDTTGIFITCSDTSITADAILFNIERSISVLRQLVVTESSE